MTQSATLRRAVFVILAVICVLQTSLLVTFTVLHVQRYHELQDTYQRLTERAHRVLHTCSKSPEARPLRHEAPGHVRRARQVTQAPVTQIGSTAHAVTPDPFIQHLTTEQEAILERHCGGTRKLCIPGPKGDTGLQGVDGLAGPGGPTGESGPKGPEGAHGGPGSAGRAGQAGAQGAKGDQGAAGAVGAKGEAGAAGAQGKPGPTGAAGTDGVEGQKGAKGETGDAGPAGAAGQVGEPGVKGDAGPRGLQGAKGPAGPKGENGSLPGRTCSCFSRPRQTATGSVSEEALPGSTVTLTCPVTGAPPPEVTWTRNGGSLPSNAVRKGSTLVITGVTQSDAGKYTCHAQNILGSTDHTVKLDVFDWKCDFESGYCGWQQGSGDQLDWTLNRGSTHTVVTGPDVDHTRGSASGQYAYLESSAGIPGSAANLQSPSVRMTGPLCLHFWYSMFGADIGSLAVFTKSSTGAETLLWTMSGEQGQGWQEANVAVTPVAEGDRTQVIIRATKQQGDKGDIAIDDISITHGLCLKTPDSVACDFQVDMCGWQKEGPWPWTRHNGSSGKPNTGPTSDHNNEPTKYYAYLSGSAVPNQGAKGRLVSPLVDANDQQVCVDFYYHMFGYGVDTLVLKVKSQDGSEQALWQRSDDQGQNWHHAHVTLPASTDPYRLVWEATRGPNAASDIAVDDMIITNGPCPLGGDLGDLGCDFELLTSCKWQQDRADALDWQLQQAETGAQSGGPGADHTLQTARGIYASVTGTAGQEAALNSIPLARNAPFCLQMWYYIPSSASGDITIYREVLQNRLQVLRTIRASSTNPREWKHLAFTVTGFYTDSNLAIVAKPGDSSAGPIAIDDVSLTPGFCA